MRPLRLARSSTFVAIALTACAGSKPAPPPAPPPPSPAVMASAFPAPPPAPPPPVSEAARKRAAHALERLAYGPRPGEVNAVAAMGADVWIRRQLAPSTIKDDALEAKLAQLPTLSMSPAELEAEYPRKQNASPTPTPTPPTTPPTTATPTPSSPARPDHRPVEIDRQLAVQKIIRAIDSERQLQEVLVDFWFNHFNVFADKGADRWLVGPYERDAIRPHVLGRFRDLLGAVAHHPAMLFYLDNWLSSADGFVGQGGNKGGLNENYGRELLELHTLGVDGGYSQGDVRETARAFTGWTIEKPQREADFVFRPRRHDDGAKTILGKSFAAGRGVKDGEDVLDLVASHPSTAKFLARKLCTKFVADDPPASVVEHVADVFTKSGGDLKATYEAIFSSAEFWSDAADETKTKTPLEVVVSAARAVGASVTVETELPRWVARMGEPLYKAQPPTGYKETSDAWVSTGSLVERINFGLAFAAGRIRGATFDRAKVGGTAGPEEMDVVVVRLALAVLPRPYSPTDPLSPATFQTIDAELRASKHGLTYQEAPDLVPQALGLILGSPEFQKQ